MIKVKDCRIVRRGKITPSSARKSGSGIVAGVFDAVVMSVW